jgi:hypothetical protein
LIADSLGHLLPFGPFRLREPANRSALLCATLDATGRVREARLHSTVQLAPGVLRRDRNRRAPALVDSLGRLDFPGTAARVGADGVLRPRSAREASAGARR